MGAKKHPPTTYFLLTKRCEEPAVRRVGGGDSRKRDENIVQVNLSPQPASLFADLSNTVLTYSVNMDFH